ncbi:MAG: hypothetical protein EKK57_07985 [Proteobacteria bacterium]|nr:MAG: hypothetical protein EKK57_07985 [Pseudomonadota bacterium]
MKKKFRSVKRKKPVIRDKYLFDRGYGRSTFEYDFINSKNHQDLLSLPNFLIYFKIAMEDELKITPRVWFFRSGISHYNPNPSREQLIVVSITALVNLIYGKKPKTREWNQIKKFIQTNRLAIQRHWSHITDSLEFFEEILL